MSETKKEKLSADDVFNKWLNDVDLAGFSRYQHSTRVPQIQILCEYLIDHEIGYDEAKFLKRKVVEILVSEKGLKKKDKHKNGAWLKQAEIDYDRTLADFYIPDLNKVKKPPVQEFVMSDDVVLWLREKYGKNVHPDIVAAAHYPLSTLHFQFVNEFYKRNTRGRL